MKTLTLHLPMPPNLTNPKRNSRWHATAAAKKKYLTLLDELQGYGILPPPPLTAFSVATISSVMHLGNAMDDDNAMARHKWALDWLRTRGYVQNDRRTNLRWTALPEQQISRKQKYELVLTITEAA